MNDDDVEGLDCTDFFHIPPTPPKPVEEPEGPSEDPSLFEAIHAEGPALDPVALEDVGVQRVALQRKFPDADPTYLERVLTSSRLHVWAMLKEKVDARVDNLIGRFLRQGGRITSHQRYEVKGNGVDWTYLRDTGLITVKTANARAGGFVYELRLDAFDVNRGARDALSSKDRRSLFELHDNRCNFCNSSTDLQADHRIGVALVGGAAEGRLDAYQAACRPCNLNKRVACGDICRLNDPEQCKTCYWAYPENHTHTAGEPGSRATFRLAPGTHPRALALLKEHGLLTV